MKAESLKNSFSETGKISEEGYKTVEGFCYKQKLIKKHVPYKDIVAAEFMDKAWENKE